MIIGFGQHHFDSTIAKAKQLVVEAIRNGDEAMESLGESLRNDDPLASLRFCRRYTNCKDCVVLWVSEGHINRNHPYSPDGVAGLWVTVMATAYRDLDGNIEVACSEMDSHPPEAAKAGTP